MIYLTDGGGGAPSTSEEPPHPSSYHIGRCVSLPLLGRFSKLDCSTTKRVPVPIPNDMSSESSRRDVSNADTFGTDTIPTVEISIMQNRPRGDIIYIYVPSNTVQ